ncbi:MAG: ABC transporter ATP-binding protein [Lachnospiraceae bacterium]|nr:ABC transporter ATP-binding protein [Lachnospiraceae bacterium]
MEKEKIIELKNVSKVFPNGVIANRNISFDIEKGEVHAIVGENGAGKSTLMNTIFGLYTPSSGEILLRGRPMKISTPSDAISQGIGMVHQHFMLIQSFTVLQNIILGAEVGNKAKINYKKARKEVMALSESFGLRIDPDTLVMDISVAMQQRVEILKVLWRKAEIIIFDEPTAVLTPQEIDEFCDMVLRLKKQGKTIIFISHKLAEVMKVSDRITIIRRGEVITTKNVDEVDEKKLAVLMVGHQITLGGGEKKVIESSEKILEVEGLAYAENGVNKLNGVSFTLSPGEIVGVAGVDGNGQDELVDIICGKKKPDSGKVEFMGRDITKNTIGEIRDMGLATVFEDRHKDGLVLSFPLKDNLILGYQARDKYLKYKVFRNEKAISEDAEILKERFDVRCSSMEVPAGTLSGGNQQKLVIARETNFSPKMLMTVQPTRGLDMGAIEYVHNKLVEHRNEGNGVLMFSLELDEILQVSDRILVIFDGKIVADLPNKNVTKREIGNYMLGVTKKEDHDSEEN